MHHDRPPLPASAAISLWRQNPLLETCSAYKVTRCLTSYRRTLRSLFRSTD